MCRRVLHIIREEAEHGEKGDDAGEDNAGGDDTHKMKRLKSDVIEAVGELIDELETASVHINQQSLEHVTPASVVFTAGGSSEVESFLREANKKRNFQCVVSESEPGGSGHKLAKTLADKGVETTVVSDAATFAIMPRVHLVVLSAKGVFADGTALCAAGHRAVAVAAKAHRVPVLVLAGTHELSPLGPEDKEYAMDDLKSPCGIFAYGDNDGFGNGDDAAKVTELTIANPAFDKVPADLISMFVTDAGGQVPGFITSLLGEFYSPEDRRFD